METTITYLMLEHHRRINKLLQAIITGFGMDKKDLRDAWVKFRDDLDGHMKTEEQVIFSFSDLGNPEVQRVIRELLAEHGHMRIIMNDIDKNFEINFGVNIYDLQKILLDHESKENEVFYPMLDAELDEHGRKFLLSKISKT